MSNNQELTEGTSSMAVFRNRKGAGKNATSRRKQISEMSDSSSSNDAEDKNEVVKYASGRKKRKNPMIQSVCFWSNNEF